MRNDIANRLAASLEEQLLAKHAGEREALVWVSHRHDTAAGRHYWTVAVGKKGQTPEASLTIHCSHRLLDPQPGEIGALTSALEKNLQQALRGVSQPYSPAPERP